MKVADISEYKNIDYAMSGESMEINAEWILNQ